MICWQCGQKETTGHFNGQGCLPVEKIEIPVGYTDIGEDTATCVNLLAEGENGNSHRKERKEINVIEVIKMKDYGLFIRISQLDAINLIHSLTAQMIADSPDVGRWEPKDSEGKEFTIAVMPRREIIGGIVK